MRMVRPVVLLTACLAAGESTLHGQLPDAAQVLASTREALGGEKVFASVKTFVATGRTRQIRGNNLVPIEFEISCELPDKFVRKDEIPAQDTDPSTLGFKGDELIQFPPPPAGRGPAASGPGPGRAGGPPPAEGAARGGAPGPEGRGRGGPP